MIIFDRLIRFFKNDIYLPKKCNAFEHQVTFNRNCRCDCKNFCKYPKINNLQTVKIKMN